MLISNNILRISTVVYLVVNTVVCYPVNTTKRSWGGELLTDTTAEQVDKEDFEIFLYFKDVFDDIRKGTTLGKENMKNFYNALPHYDSDADAIVDAIGNRGQLGSITPSPELKSKIDNNGWVIGGKAGGKIIPNKSDNRFFGTITTKYNFEYVKDGELQSMTIPLEYKNVHSLYHGIPVIKTSKLYTTTMTTDSQDKYGAVLVKEIVGEDGEITYEEFKYGDAMKEITNWVNTYGEVYKDVLVKHDTSSVRTLSITERINKAATARRNGVVNDIKYTTTKNGVQPDPKGTLTPLEEDAWDPDYGIYKFTANQNKKIAASHVKAFSQVALLGKAMWKFRANPENPDDKSPYDIEGTSCSTKGTISKRAGDTCLAPIKIINEDDMDATNLPDEGLIQTELEGFYALAYNLGITEVGDGYDWSSGIPRDWDDYTELDHDFIFKGSLSIDDALDKLESAIMSKLDELDVGDHDARGNIARAINKLRYANRVRIANLKVLGGDIKVDKQITAEARKDAMDKISSKYTLTTGRTPDDDERNSDLELDLDTADLNIDGLIEYFEPGLFDDYRDADTIRSLAEADFLDIAQDAFPNLFGSLSSAPDVENGGESIIDVTAMVQGSTSFRTAMKSIGKSIGDAIKNQMDRDLEQSEEQLEDYKKIYKKIRVALSRLYRGLNTREIAIENKIASGVEVKQAEIDDYSAIHDTFSSISSSMTNVAPSIIEAANKISEPVDYVVDEGIVRTVPIKKTYKAVSGTNKNFISGIRSFIGSPRYKNSARKLTSNRGTRS